ncbi:MAG: MBL fold metallo-hydrolase [Coriobacteriales bacterium]|nr:MBL fold metallo-hydrolase [Coriobacteriales bacterium]
MTKLLYQGHGSLRLTTNAGTVVYVDPFMGEGYDVAANLVLVTHQHYDHTDINKMPHAPGCVVWQNMDAHPSPDSYVTHVFGDVEVEGTEAYNAHHPKDECVGYLVRVDGLTLYFAGDTSQTEQMERLAAEGVDYAFLPGDGIYNMSVEGAARCAKIIGARHNVPIHLKPVQPYGEEQARRFAKLAPRALLVRAGQTIEL